MFSVITFLVAATLVGDPQGNSPGEPCEAHIHVQVVKVVRDFLGVLQMALGSLVEVLAGDADSQNGDIHGLIPRCYLAGEGDVVINAENLCCSGGTWKDWDLHSHRRRKHVVATRCLPMAWRTYT